MDHMDFSPTRRKPGRLSFRFAHGAQFDKQTWDPCSTLSMCHFVDCYHHHPTPTTVDITCLTPFSALRHPRPDMQDSAQPADRTASVTGSAGFDPDAVAPAFALPSTSTHAPPSTLQRPPRHATQASSVPASTLSATHLSIPALGDASLMGELPTTDPLATLLQKHLPPHIRPLRDLSGTWHASTTTNAAAGSSFASSGNEIPDPFLSSDPSAEVITPETVRQAAASNAWRKIASLARAKIEDYGNTQREQLYRQKQIQLVDVAESQQAETMGVEEVLDWWTVRLYSLARLKLFSMLATELNGVWHVLASTRLDQGQRLVDTDVVPFTMKVVKATEPKYRGDVRGTVEAYTRLIRLCKDRMRQARSEQGGKAQLVMWKRRAERIGLMLSFTLAEAKDFSGAIEVVLPLVERALERKKEASAEELEKNVRLVIVASRLWIQAGDLSGASTLLDRASSLVDASSTLHTHLDHSRAVLHAISGDFDAASTLLSTNTSPAAQLNSAVIAFYSAHLDDSISQLENVLQSEPALAASADAVVFNLATLYELGKGGEAQVVDKKRELLASVARWAGEPGVSGSAFKL